MFIYKILYLLNVMFEGKPIVSWGVLLQVDNWKFKKKNLFISQKT